MAGTAMPSNAGLVAGPGELVWAEAPQRARQRQRGCKAPSWLWELRRSFMPCLITRVSQQQAFLHPGARSAIAASVCPPTRGLDTVGASRG